MNVSTARWHQGATIAAGTAITLATSLAIAAPAAASPSSAPTVIAQVEAAERSIGLVDDHISDRVRVVEPGDAVTIGADSEALSVTPGEEDEGGQGNANIAYTVDRLTPDETRLSAVVSSHESEPPSWDFPTDNELTVLSDGRVSVASASGDLLAGIEAPWAVDATGRRLATHYEVSDSELIQVVSTDAATVFPVVADPKFNQYIGYWTVTLNRSESATAVGTVAGCAALFSKSPVPALRAMTLACGVLAAFSGAQLAGGKCVRVHVAGIPPTLGTWWPTFPKC